jgi:hypothetical protein
MKTKKFEKKLVLKKSTIVDLTDSQSAMLKGGTTAPCITKPRYTCVYTCVPNTDVTCDEMCP